MGVNSLPTTVTRQRRDCDLNPGPTAPDSSTLTTRLPIHPVLVQGLNFMHLSCCPRVSKFVAIVKVVSTRRCIHQYNAAALPHEAGAFIPGGNDARCVVEISEGGFKFCIM